MRRRWGLSVVGSVLVACSVRTVGVGTDGADAGPDGAQIGPTWPPDGAAGARPLDGFGGAHTTKPDASWAGWAGNGTGGSAAGAGGVPGTDASGGAGRDGASGAAAAGAAGIGGAAGEGSGGSAVFDAAGGTGGTGGTGGGGGTKPDAGSDAGVGSSESCPGQLLTLTGSPPSVTVTGDLSSMTHEETCAATCDYCPGADAVYRYLAPDGSGMGTISLEPQGFDAILELRVTSCDGPSIGCSDQGGAEVTEIAYPNDPDVEHFVVVDSKSAGGPFTLRITY